MKHYKWTGAKLKWIADNGLQAVAVGSAMAHNRAVMGWPTPF